MKSKTNQTASISGPSFEVRLPASTSNLGAGIDCFGLALQLYLTIRATVAPRATMSCRIRNIGTSESAELPRNAENLIYRAMAYTARLESVQLPPIRLAAHNEIPIARGLGSSAAAIVGGIKLCGLICNREIPDEKVLEYATRFEGHPDNVAATLFGGFVVTCLAWDGKVIPLKRPWPSILKLLIVSPRFQVETKLARAALARVVNRSDAVHNLQRSALFVAAVAESRYDLLWEAMRDRLHQERRQTLVPGLAEVLALRQMPGLMGVALSGAGPSVCALVTSNFDEIGEAIAGCFARHKIRTTTRRLEVENEGCRSTAAK
jgi:homoserine kinase